MKKALCISFLFLLAGCAGESSQSGSDSVKNDTIDTVSKVVPVGNAGDEPPPPPPDSGNSMRIADSTFRSTFRFYFTSTYCGGARPTEEILQEKSTPKPLTNSTMKLVNHFTGVEYVVKTDAKATGSVNLIEGKYDVYLTKDINPSLPTGFDAKCTLWTKQLLFTVKVANDGKTRDVTIHFDCNPCDNNVKMRP